MPFRALPATPPETPSFRESTRPSHKLPRLFIPPTWAETAQMRVSVAMKHGELRPILPGFPTYLGGSGGCGMPPCDAGLDIKVDGSGNAYVVGNTASTDFAGAGTLQALGAFQPTLLNTVGGDAFIAKLNPAGSGQGDLLYATYFGGSDGMSPDQGLGIAIDSATPPN